MDDKHIYEQYTRRSRFLSNDSDRQFMIGFALLLYILGGGLIWFFYGLYAAILGIGCMTGGILFLLLLYSLISLIGRWAE